MARLRPTIRSTAFLLAVAMLAACGPSDRTSRTTPAPDAAAGAATAESPPPALSPLQPASASAGADTLADSLLIQRADRGRILGRADAMWVVMISDFQCPYCKQWHDQTMANLQRDYIDKGKVRMAYLHLPLSNHRYARVQAEASMCAAAQDKFWPYADRLFRDQQLFQNAQTPTMLLSGIAREVQLDMPAFTTCTNSAAIRLLVENDERQAAQAKVQSTPTFLVGDFLVQGALPYADFRRAIDTALAVTAARKSR
jgi:protein-disulfide isomerase